MSQIIFVHYNNDRRTALQNRLALAQMGRNYQIFLPYICLNFVRSSFPLPPDLQDLSLGHSIHAENWRLLCTQAVSKIPRPNGTHKTRQTRAALTVRFPMWKQLKPVPNFSCHASCMCGCFTGVKALFLAMVFTVYARHMACPCAWRHICIHTYMKIIFYRSACMWI